MHYVEVVVVLLVAVKDKVAKLGRAACSIACVAVSEVESVRNQARPSTGEAYELAAVELEPVETSLK